MTGYFGITLWVMMVLTGGQRLNTASDAFWSIGSAGLSLAGRWVNEGRLARRADRWAEREDRIDRRRCS